VHGRNAPTGITLLKSWDALEEEMSHIWENAQTYNEDGSDIFNLADDLKVGWKHQDNCLSSIFTDSNRLYSKSDSF
jgi:hypothetical protein